ncbi:MaoC family dehydratase [Actinophytocola sp.]|uniref:MaoC family dehydratase n=1 Tax=Actinophytocola sp. TaxID=1872138 RepID=UPI003D6BC119
MTGTRVFANLDELTAATGEHLGVSEWIELTQERIDTFADATGDDQWIHVDPERAEAGPFGATIAHGHLTLSLIPLLSRKVFQVNGISMGVNYGLDKVRFLSIVPVGSRVRARVELLEVVDKPRGKQATLRTIVEIEGGAGIRACVAESLVLYVP